MHPYPQLIMTITIIIIIIIKIKVQTKSSIWVVLPQAGKGVCSIGTGHSQSFFKSLDSKSFKRSCTVRPSFRLWGESRRKPVNQQAYCWGAGCRERGVGRGWEGLFRD